MKLKLSATIRNLCSQRLGLRHSRTDTFSFFSPESIHPDGQPYYVFDDDQEHGQRIGTLNEAFALFAPQHAITAIEKVGGQPRYPWVPPTPHGEKTVFIVPRWACVHVLLNQDIDPWALAYPAGLVGKTPDGIPLFSGLIPVLAMIDTELAAFD